MKKIIVLLLCLALLPVAALAGTAPLEVRDLGDNMTLVYALPEGVNNIEIEEIYEMGVVTFDLEDATKPQYIMTISYGEELQDQDLSDLTQDELDALAVLTAGDSEAWTYETKIMEDGWPAIWITYDEETDWVDAFTVISGYFIQIHGWHEDFSPLTAEEDAFALTLLDGIDFVETEPEA